MEFVFQDELGHTMLNALRELGEGINKLSVLESKISNCDVKEFDVVEIVNTIASSTRQNVLSEELSSSYYSPEPPLHDSFEFDPLPPPPISPVETSPKRQHHHEQEQQQQQEQEEEEDQRLPITPILEENSEVNVDQATMDVPAVVDEDDSAVADDDDDDDDWENDDDLGYVTVQLTEQEFFVMEEEAIMRHSLLRVCDQDQVRSKDEQEEFEQEEEENNEQQQDEVFDLIAPSNDDYDHYDNDDDENELNQSFRREEDETDLVQSTSYLMSLDLRAHSPELSIEKVENAINSMGLVNNGDQGDHDNQEEDQDQIEDNEADLESDFAKIEEMGNTRIFSNNAADTTERASHTMGSLYSVGNPERRRETEIWGQRKILGVDGEHRYFDLKVIFEPLRTGFEEDKNFNPVPGTIVAGRYEVAEMLGQAAFSTAWQCVDLNAEGVGNEWVCLKVIKNSKDFFDQSLDEIKLLQYINSKGDPHKHNVLKMIDFFYCKEHLFIVSELLRENLYEFGKYIRESGAKEYFTLPRLKKIVKQILEALVYIHSLNLIHCDIKPENIVIRSYSRCEVKLIDFGSSCFTTDHLTSYIQSRSYRAPEVILGLDYGPRIDIWSLGGVLAEMHTGYVLFQNDSIATMLARIQGILGPYPSHMLENGREVGRYFSSSGTIFERTDDGEGNFTTMLVFPKKTTLRHRLHLPRENLLTEDESKFLDFVGWMLQLDPERRPLAGQALLHPWLDDVDLNDVSYVDT